MLIKYAAPTLAGIKTANLFAIRSEFDLDLKKAISKFNQNVRAKNIRLLPIYHKAGRTLLYIYRPERLKKDISCELCRQRLELMGYPVEKPDACIKEYAGRLSRSKCFLHEIGFFLGYPSEDVIAFMECGPSKAKCCGCWKSYSNEEEAKKIFEQFKECRDTYYLSWKEGASVEELTLAI